MSMTPLSVEDIAAQLISDIEGKIGATIPFLPIAFIRVLSKALAAGIVLLYKYVGFIFLQLFVATASDKETMVGGLTIVPLTEWGRLVGLGPPVAAVPAELTATVLVLNQTGQPIPSGTTLVYEPTGVVYAMTASVLRDAATKTITIEAISDQTGGGGVGTIGNLTNGSTLSFSSPVADVQRNVDIASTVVTGEDAESSILYRQRVLDRFQKPPQGGALADYEAWALEAPGIIRALVYTGALPGTVEVYLEADTVSSGSPDGIPTQPQLDAALALIDLDQAGRATRRPANALAFTLAITRKAFKVVVIALDAPDPSTMETSIADGLDILFAEFEPFIGGLTVTPRDRVTQSEVSGVVHDITSAGGATFSSVTLETQVPAQTSYGQFVVASSDDATQVGTSFTSLTAGSLTMHNANTIGVRFLSLTIPADATVLTAELVFVSLSDRDGYTVLDIMGEADANPSTFGTGGTDISGRVTTVNTVAWTPDAWLTDEVKRISVVSIVEELIAVPGYAAGNAMVFIIQSALPNDRQARSFNNDPTKAPRLEITFLSPTVGFAPQAVTTLGVGELAKVTDVSFP